MPRNQNTAGKKARAAARGGEKYTVALRRQSTHGGAEGSRRSAVAASLAHRALLDHVPGFRPFHGTGLFDRIGGQPAVDKLVDVLYDGLADDARLRPLFPRDLAAGRSMQKVFFAEWLGGPGRYSERSHAGLVHRHGGLPLTRELAERWLGHFRRALKASVATATDRDAVDVQVSALALALVNAPSGGADGAEPGTPVATCGVGARTVTAATGNARRGDVAGVATALRDAPDLLRPIHTAAIMQAAALAGRTDVVRLLLDRGVGADDPFYLPIAMTGAAYERVLFVTPLCAARLKRRSAVEVLLVAGGAADDVFTAAFLGDQLALNQILRHEPDLARASDPAVDVLDITPVDHEVAGGQAAALRIVLDHLTGPLPAGGVRALRGAAAQGSVPMVETLLGRGADATRIGVGRWVLHPQLAPLLSGRGGSIDSSGAWIGASCTGNQGRKDDPDYVRALLRHGARATDRRVGPSGISALEATALHYAAKAGFLQTIQLLLEHGADPRARDSRGHTPLDWLDEAAPSVPRAAVRRLLGRPR